MLIPLSIYCVCISTVFAETPPPHESMLSIDLVDFPKFIDPAANMNNSGWYLLSSTSATLFDMAEDQSLRGVLAESWSAYDGGRRFRVTVREDAFFHDGSRITAEDIVFSFKRKQINWPDYPVYQWINPKKNQDSIRIIGSRTIEFQLDRPYDYFLYLLALPGTGVVPKAIYPLHSLYHPEKLPILGGPYRIVEWKRNDYLKLRWHDKWFEPIGKRPSTIVVYERKDPEALDRFVAGETHLFLDRYDRIIDTPGLFDKLTALGIHSFVPQMNNVYVAYLNAVSGSFKNKELREAFAALLRLFLQEQNSVLDVRIPADQFFPPGYSGRVVVRTRPSSDFEEVYARLRREPVTLRYMFPDTWTMDEMERRRISFLARYGFNVEVHKASFSQMKENRLKGEGFDFGFLFIPVPPGDPCLVFSLDFGPDDFYIPDPNDGTLYNMIDKAATLSRASERVQLAKDINRYLVTESFIVPLFFMSHPLFAKKTVDFSATPKWLFSIKFADLRVASDVDQHESN
ncbi:MAG TPA: ABC transporter substrate-binding protein [Bdellovibrionota bacterium]|nr:ABC transporter substrate-binding protein [Bdellovibrionota bacterium]